MGFLSQIGNIFTGDESARAARKAGNIQNEAAQQAITGQIAPAGERAIARFDPLAGVAQQGIDQAGFLTDPQAQFDFIQQNPLFQLGLQNLNEQTQQSAASRGRLTAGDTLEQLTQNATLASQPLIDRQRQDIMGLLNLGSGVAGQQGQIDLSAAGQITDLLTGGAAAKAGGIVGAQNARTDAFGNIIDLGTTLATSGFGG